MATPPNKRIRGRFYCNHCDDHVSKSTFYDHKRQYCHESSSTGTEQPLDTLSTSSLVENTTDDEYMDSMGDMEYEADITGHNADENSSDTSEYSDTDESCIPSEMLEDSDDNETDVQETTITPVPLRIFLTFLIVWQFCFNVSETAVGVLVAFFKKFVQLLGEYWMSGNNSSTFVQACPATYKSCLTALDLEKKPFIEYIVCPDKGCNAMYHLKDCILHERNTETSAKCRYVRFPNHPQRNHRKECGTVLLKEVQLKGGKIKWTPRKVYCYHSVKDSISRLVTRPGFLEKCEKWRSRTTHEHIMFDIYDGRIWKDFQVVNDKPFLSVPYNFALSLGCDWFQPFKHLTDSVGAIYMVILNLPREERYKPENIILVGIIPGPHEPKKTINTYLYPLIQELLSFWDGVYIREIDKTIRLALLCVSCDIPATRKLCGFSSHSAIHGCSKCHKEFPSGVFENKLDFSGYDRSRWKPRKHFDHYRDAISYRDASTQTEQKALLKKNGARYSVLLLLPYFDVVRMHVVDPMHNLLLGTAKHQMELWTTGDQRWISGDQFKHIHKIVSAIHIPKQVGRIPSKIGSSFAGFSADQWRNWTTVYSSVALKTIIPSSHLNCWLMYVRACNILCARAIDKRSVETADQYLLNFCRKFVEVYGAQPCTINLHLHLHLKECILDYGPLYAWWCFAFERYNGILGNYHTNQRSIEPQIMRKFLYHQHALFLQLPSDFAQFLSRYTMQNTVSGSLNVQSMPSCTPEVLLRLNTLSISSMPALPSLSFCTSESEVQIPPVYEKIMYQDMAQKLTNIYSFLYPNKRYSPISYLYTESSRVIVSQQVYGSQQAKSDRLSAIIARWPQTVEHSTESELQAGFVQYFLKHKTVVHSITGTNQETHIFACVKWLRKHMHRNWYGQSAIVCEHSMHNDPNVGSALSLLPVQRILKPCAYFDTTIDFGSGFVDNVTVFIPVHATYSIS